MADNHPQEQIAPGTAELWSAIMLSFQNFLLKGYGEPHKSCEYNFGYYFDLNNLGEKLDIKKPSSHLFSQLQKVFLYNFDYKYLKRVDFNEESYTTHDGCFLEGESALVLLHGMNPESGYARKNNFKQVAEVHRKGFITVARKVADTHHVICPSSYLKFPETNGLDWSFDKTECEIPLDVNVVGGIGVGKSTVCSKLVESEWSIFKECLLMTEKYDPEDLETVKKDVLQAEVGFTKVHLTTSGFGVPNTVSERNVLCTNAFLMAHNNMETGFPPSTIYSDVQLQTMLQGNAMNILFLDSTPLTCLRNIRGRGTGEIDGFGLSRQDNILVAHRRSKDLYKKKCANFVAATNYGDFDPELYAFICERALRAATMSTLISIERACTEHYKFGTREFILKKAREMTLSYLAGLPKKSKDVMHNSFCRVECSFPDILNALEPVLNLYPRKEWYDIVQDHLHEIPSTPKTVPSCLS